MDSLSVRYQGVDWEFSSYLWIEKTKAKTNPKSEDYLARAIRHTPWNHFKMWLNQLYVVAIIPPLPGDCAVQMELFKHKLIKIWYDFKILAPKLH